MVVADVVARTAEEQGLQAFIAHVGDMGVGEAPRLIELARSSLGIRPAVGLAASEAELPTPSNGPTDLHLIGPGLQLHPQAGGMLAAVGRILADSGADAALSGILSEPAAEPLCIRKALLSAPHYDSADLTMPTLSSERETLRIWRHHVARWAEFPSSPVPPEIKTTIRLFSSQLDTPALMRLLEEVVQDDGAPPGAKFETFIFADRILGLDLGRWIGQPDS